MAGTEGAEYVKDLNQNAPGGSDLVSDGDDHLRMIKKSLLQSFPSDIEVQIPDIDGHAGSSLVVNETGDGVVWVGRSSVVNRLFNRATIRVSDDTLTVGPGVYYIPENLDFTEWTADTIVSISDGADRHLYIYIKASDGSLFTDPAAPVQEIDGWFNGEDRCIGAVYQKTDGSIHNQYHDGGDYVMYGSKIHQWGTGYSTTGWQTKALNTPAFADRVQVTFDSQSMVSGITSMYWRPTGTDENNLIAKVEKNESELSVGSWSIYTGYQQTIDVDTSGESLDTYLEGYCLSGGM